MQRSEDSFQESVDRAGESHRTLRKRVEALCRALVLMKASEEELKKVDINSLIVVSQVRWEEGIH